MTSTARRTAILLLLDERHRQDPSWTVDDTELAESLNIPVEEVRRQLDILEDEELIRSANTFGGHSAYISPKGMAAADGLRDAAQAAPKRKVGFDEAD
jgi:predicted ArsR family transcriptional regulator